MKIASQVSIVRVIDEVNQVGLFLNKQLVMSRKEEDGPAREIMREVANNLEVFTGRHAIMVEFEKRGSGWTWDEVIELIRDSKSDKFRTSQSMLVSVDGGETYSVAVEGVRVIYPNRSTEADKPAELHVAATPEGIIYDLYTGPIKFRLDTHAGTVGEEVDNLMASCEEANL